MTKIRDLFIKLQVEVDDSDIREMEDNIRNAYKSVNNEMRKAKSNYKINSAALKENIRVKKILIATEKRRLNQLRTASKRMKRFEGEKIWEHVSGEKRIGRVSEDKNVEDVYEGIKNKIDDARVAIANYKHRMSDLYSENQKNIASIKDRKAAIKDNVGMMKKKLRKDKEAIKQAKRFKGENLSLMFIMQGLAQPFNNILQKIGDITGLFKLFSNIIMAIVLPVLMPFITNLISLGGWLAKNKELFDKIIAYIVLFGAIFGSVLGVVSGVLILFGIAMTSTIMGVVAIIAGALALIIANWEEYSNVLYTTFIEPFKRAWKWVKELFGIWTDDSTSFKDKIVATFEHIWDGIKGIIDWLKDVAVANFELFIAIIEDLIDWLKKLDDWLTGGKVTDFFNSVGEWANNAWEGFFGGGKQMGGRIRQEGMYYLHAGEEVISANPSGYQGDRTFNNTFSINANVSDSIDIDNLARAVAKKLGRMV